MLVVETIAKNRRAHCQDRKSIKQICRKLRVSRKMVRKVTFTKTRATKPYAIGCANRPANGVGSTTDGCKCFCGEKA